MYTRQTISSLESQPTNKTRSHANIKLLTIWNVLDARGAPTSPTNYTITVEDDGLKISIGGAEATLLQLEIEPVVRYLTSLFDEGGLNKERTLGWAQELLNRGESSLLVKLKGKMILLT